MEKKKILIVEDEFITAAALRVSLEGYGYEVAGTTDTGEGAIQSAGDLRPDLVLMDIQLIGEMNGITAAGIIRKKFDIPVIYVTGQSDDATIAQALESEPFGYIIKPFEEKNLKAGITMALYKHDMDRKLAQKNDDLLKLSAALDGMKDCVIITRYGGQIEYANAEAFRRFGYSAGELIGQEFSVLQAPDNRLAVSKDTFVEDTKQVWTGTFHAKSKPGAAFKLALKSTPIFRNNEMISRVFVLREPVGIP